MNLRRVLHSIAVLGLILTTRTAVNAQAPRAKLGFEDPTVPKVDIGDDATLPKIPAIDFLPSPSGKVVTGIPVAQKKEVAAVPTPILSPEGWAATSPFTGRVSVRADVGDGVGYSRGYTFAEAMIPLRQDAQSLLFADVRVVNFDHENHWEYNVGGGYRWFSPRLDHVLGLNAFYDSRKTDHHGYHQLGAGFEVLGQTLELRGNGYFIVGAAHHVIGDTGVVAQGVIVNNNFIFQRVQTVEAALGGVDIEIGGPLPVLERYWPRAYVGFYSYSADGIGVANGVRGRLQAQLGDRVSAHFVIQNDQLFGTTVSGGLAVHFGASAYRTGRGRPSWDDVLRQPVRRDVNIVIATSTTNTTSTEPVPPPPPPPPPPEESEGE